MPEIVILLGSNLGNRKKNLETAIEKISVQVGLLVSASKIYETEPWGDGSEGLFFNQVIVVETKLNPENTLNQILKIEKEMGRVRELSNKNASRLIDLDILFYGTEIIDNDKLQIPHPRLHLRRFTLVPMAEIMPDFIHPVLNQSVSELLQNCKDMLMVKAK